MEIDNLPPMELLRLQELRLQLDGIALEEDITSFFNALVIPNICHLELTRSRGFRQLPFMSLLLRPHKIDTMSFVPDGCTTECLLEFFRLVPSLRRLALNSPFEAPDEDWDPSPATLMTPPEECVRLDEVLLNHLTPTLPLNEPESSTVLCPLLEEIELRFSPDVVVPDDAIIRFLRARTTRAPEGITRLTHGSFFLKRAAKNSSPEILTEMRPERDIGLNPDVFYYPQPWIDRLANICPVFTPYQGIEVSEEPCDNWKPGFLLEMF
ncbi:hypothetical protein H0H81_006979 [Sphagnurus paluster]|uniref:Uncharacterized protein n=1 Tax=Sphagnurus paluster TaxID=117069 RepID=A0A9P7KIR2_9AGAR|nr:hypothetical protein H0H81_006979 [Sphagnurus paluster]